MQEDNKTLGFNVLLQENNIWGFIIELSIDMDIETCFLNSDR